jgi:hypothetical protein
MMDKVQKPSNSECYTPSSEPFKFCRLRASENRVLRGILGPKRDEVTGGWRIMHNEKLRRLYSAPCVIENETGWEKNIARMGCKKPA